MLHQNKSFQLQLDSLTSPGLKMPFIEIAFQAEVSRFEDQDFEELARRNCNEDPDNRSKKIEELRSMIYGNY